MTSSETEVVEAYAGGMVGIMPSAWRTEGKPAWLLEIIRTGWRRCPDGVWRYPPDWPRLRLP